MEHSAEISAADCAVLHSVAKNTSRRAGLK